MPPPAYTPPRCPLPFSTQVRCCSAGSYMRQVMWQNLSFSGLPLGKKWKLHKEIYWLLKRTCTSTLCEHLVFFLIIFMNMFGVKEKINNQFDNQLVFECECASENHILFYLSYKCRSVPCCLFYCCGLWLCMYLSHTVSSANSLGALSKRKDPLCSK